MNRSGEILDGMARDIIDAGEVPYQANRRAIRAFDVQGDVGQGLQELTVLVNGIDVTIAKLERFENAARKIARGFSSVR